jgi:glyoxylase-like metal-dependent hydrolase (beta-lactamase superfamily II)/rhodanese-related sulfurtransferase
MTATAHPSASASISVDELRHRLDRNEPTYVLDVRPASERKEWAIPGSSHVDAYQALRSGDAHVLDGIRPPEGATVVTVCARGNTSRIAAALLKRRGIPARSLEGGMKAWSLAWNTAEVALPDSNLRVSQVRRTGKGCLSYVLASNGEAAVIDPSLPIRVYRDLAEEMGAEIRKVIETHIHADHLSRAGELAQACGAALHVPRQNRSYSAQWVDEGTVIPVGQAMLRAIRTPGHTIESTCYIADDRALLTGDTLFLDSVGRPDLEASATESRERAHMLHASLQRLIALDPDLLVLPGHTGAPVPFDRRPLAAPLSRVRDQVELLGRAENEFVETILNRLPATPPNHHQIVELNETGVLPEMDLTDLEAGANRCAIA